MENLHDVPLTTELLQAFGFTYLEDKDAWMDEFGLMIYTSRLPQTTMGLKRVMCGTAFRKGQDKTRRQAADHILVQLFGLPGESPQVPRPSMEKTYSDLFPETTNY
ncbi:hypothetical protein GCM10028806_34430 [Spirosoma terrae]|uniref:Aminopeptidase n=1 Tax=Spirosoma terrae TaxID=1968276 RepID=A0A6L9L8D8_9BACT|nr:aminopeptidase [Spirosoma terrae]NDU95757.1 aminopeptidase [Spirosoma terrae]